MTPGPRFWATFRLVSSLHPGRLGASATVLAMSAALLSACGSGSSTPVLNWYINPNLKIQWNYLHANRDVVAPQVSGGVDALGMRIQLTF